MKSDREKFLEEEILRHKKLYYAGRPEISDDKFDSLEDELKKINPHNYALSIVGSVASGPKKISHDTKMLSLEKTYVISDLEKWMGKNELLSIFKIDGVSCSLIYKDGELILGKTRGDGSVGEDITEKCRWINDIPKEVRDLSCEVRGEIFCTEESFLRLSKEMESRGLERPSSQRNIVAGLISRKDSIDLCSYLSFNAFDLIGDNKIKKEHEKLDCLSKLGFIIPEYELHKSFKTIQGFINKSADFIAEGEYQIDGVVFVIDDIETQNSLGVTAHHPKYKMAFKFKGESKETTVLGIEWYVSRNGILTPVAKVEKTELSGAVVENVTLHNFGIVKQFNIKKGDRISIIRSGEVIPKFLEVIKSSPGVADFPKKCPSCESALEEEEIRLYCKNENCPEKNKAQILNYIQKIGIEDLSEKRLEEMMKKGMVKTIPDLYRLTVPQLLTLDKTKEKLANKLFENIQNTKELELAVFLSGLGISGGAYNKCQKIVQSGYNSIDKILHLKIEDLMNIESFAEKSATEFINSLIDKKETIKQLLKHDITFKKDEKASDLLQGKSFCITGALSEKREVIEERIRKNGGRVLSGVSQNLDYLVTNESDSGSSKAEKAKKLGINIINEEQLRRFLQKGIA